VVNVSANKSPFRKLFKYALAILIGYSIGIRLSLYLSNPCFWLDELMLALNITERSFLNLLKALDHNQAAPAGFLYAAKTLVLLIGNNEFVLRAIPLTAGIASFYLFYLLLKLHSDKKTIFMAFFLFSLSSYLIRYSIEFKPYMSDMFVSLSLLLIFNKLFLKNLSLKNGLLLILSGLLAFLFSFPSIFFISAAFIAYPFFYYSKARIKELKGFFFIMLFWAVGILVIYLFIIRPSSNNRFLLWWWDKTFMPLSFKSIEDLFWLPASFVRMFFQPGGIASFGVFLSAVLFLLGGFSYFKKNKFLTSLFLLPLLLALLISSVRIYPFYGRLLIFYAPIMYLLIAEGLAYLMNAQSGILQKFGLILAVIICFSSFFDHNPQTLIQQDIRPILRYVEKNKKEDDAVFVLFGAHYGFTYYSKILKINFPNVVVAKKYNLENLKNYNRSLKGLLKNKRLWIISSHIFVIDDTGEDVHVLNFLNRQGEVLDSFRSQGAFTRLYEL